MGHCPTGTRNRSDLVTAMLTKGPRPHTPSVPRKSTWSRRHFSRSPHQIQLVGQSSMNIRARCGGSRAGSQFYWVHIFPRWLSSVFHVRLCVLEIFNCSDSKTQDGGNL